MIIKSKQTTLAYRCPSCGAGVMSAVDIFKLSADMVKLKCDCSQSSMTAVYVKDEKNPKIRLTVPCIFCPNPHTFTVSSSIFFKDDLFLLPCPYSDMTVAVTGETDRVKAELSRSELELIELLEKSGISSLDEIPRKTDNDAEQNPEIVETVLHALRMLDSEGSIECGCPKGEGDYEISLNGGEAIIECKRCKQKKALRADSLMQAHALLELDKLTLEPTT